MRRATAQRHPKSFFIAAFLVALIFVAAAPLARQQPSLAAAKAGSKISTAIRCCISKARPYEMGYQHGALLKQSVRENIHNIFGILAGQSLTSAR